MKAPTIKSAEFINQRTSLRLRLIATVALVIAGCLLYASGARTPEVGAQSTFVGDYDTSFAAPLGYYVDPERPVAPADDTFQTYFHTGELLPDGSIIAGGRHVNNASRGDFYLRKFTASGAVDTSFGTNGFVRTNFSSRFDGADGDDIPSVLKVQPDGKIVFAGKCVVHNASSTSPNFGVDACVVRYNANGTLDQTFGGSPVPTTGAGTTVHSIPIDPGKVIFQTGVRADGGAYGTDGNYYDMAIQPDGKIVLVGETRNYASFHVAQGYGAIVVRLNPDGSRDTTFGDNGIARWTAPEGPTNCFPARSFHGVLLQPDGRIIAVGYNSVTNCGGSASPGSRFVVTRWTAAGQLEAVRHLDNNTTFNSQDEGASAVHFTRDASKILVSGAYKNLGSASAPQQPTMVRFNLSDLSLDTTFGTGGIRQYNGCQGNTCGFSSGGRLRVKAIQPDGKILGVDDGPSNGNVVRFNPDGSPDQSFGNLDANAGGPGRGRLRVFVTNYNGNVRPLEAGQILVRPNGRINLIGYSIAFDRPRAAVSQNTSVGAQNPIDDPQTFTFVHYYDFLNREADSAGLNFWTNEITSCGSNAACIEEKRINVSAAFFLSIEFQNTGYFVFRHYKSTFTDSTQRPRGLPRMTEFLADTRVVGEGVIVGQAGWEQKLEENKQNFARNWVQRAEVLAQLPAEMTAVQFVDKLFQNSEVTPTQAERDAAIAAFGAGGVEGRAAALRSVINTRSVYNRQYNPAFVLMQYIGYLRRNPNDAPDGNYAGYDFWLAKLNSFSDFTRDVREEAEALGRVRRAEMVKSFLVSGEYRARFGRP